MHTHLVASNIGDWFFRIEECKFFRYKNAFTKILTKLGQNKDDLSKLKSKDFLNLCRKKIDWWSIDFTILEKQEFVKIFINYYREAILMWIMLKFGSNSAYFAEITQFFCSDYTQKELVSFLYDLYMWETIWREMYRHKLLKSLDKNVVSEIFWLAVKD